MLEVVAVVCVVGEDCYVSKGLRTDHQLVMCKTEITHDDAKLLFKYVHYHCC